MSISAERQRMVNAPPHWVFFVLTNPDILTQLSGSILKVRRCSDRLFRGALFGFKIDMEITGDREPRDDGNIDIMAEAKVPWGLGKSSTMVHYRYKSVTWQTTSVDMDFEMKPSGLFMRAYVFFLRRRIDAYLSNVMQECELATTALAGESTAGESNMTEEQLARISDFRQAHADTAGPGRECPADVVNEFEHSLTDLGKRVDVLADELDKALGHAVSDPNTSLMYARTALEKLLVDFYRRRTNREPRRQEIGAILNDKDVAATIDAAILVRMHSIRTFGNAASHGRSTFGARDANDALYDLSLILQWYIEELATAEKDHSPEARFREFCERCYASGVPDIEDRQKIDAHRQELGLTSVEAEQLEREATPPGISELKGAVEMAGVDGILNDTERKHLYALAKRLDVDKGDARQLIEGYGSNLADSLKERYAALCREYYRDSIPSPEQRAEMARMRRSIGISEADAARIEKRALPREMLELQVMVEALCADGMMNDLERSHVIRKGLELGIAPDLADRMTKEVSRHLEAEIERQFASFCAQFYVDSFPDPEQRKQIEQKRVDFGMPTDHAQRIEDECVPAVFDEYRATVDGILADGEINESERAHLESKAEQLGISRELASRIEEERMEMASPEVKFRLFCKSLYEDAALWPDRQQLMVQKRQDLGLTEGAAREIESTSVPDKIEEYRAAVEGIHADGKVDANERDHLDRKAGQLGLSPELAKHIEVEYTEKAPPELRFRFFCEKLYRGSYPTEAQREAIRAKSTELGLADDVAAQIEASSVPREIIRFRDAVEGVLADGKVDENERAYLDHKAKELGISDEMAKQIERDLMQPDG